MNATRIIQKLFFSFFLISFFIIKNVQSLENTPLFNFPIALILPNDNIFVVHEDGVSILDHSSNLITNVVNFTSSEKISSDYSFLKVTIAKFENDYIVILMQEKIYFFDYKGTFIFKTSGYFNPYAWGNYYQIVPIKYYNGDFFYIVVYKDTDSESLFFAYYKFNLINKENK